MTSPRLFPVFLKLAGRKVVVVGAGKVAAGKLPALLSSQADVVVIAPEACDEVVCSGARIERRPFHPSDLDGAWYAVAAATPPVNAEVARAAEERRIFVNAVDDKSSASAYLGAVLERGGVTAAFSTEGQAPAVAGLLREGIDALLPTDLDRWVAEAESLRAQWKADKIPMANRRPLLLQALNKIYDARSEGLLYEPAGPAPDGSDNQRRAEAGTGNSKDRTPV